MINKTILTILTLLYLTTYSTAQSLAEKYDHIKEDFLGKTYIGVGIGAAIPFNEFANKDPNSSSSGYAKIGFTYNFTFRYAFSDYFGIAAKYFSTSNQFDAQKYQNDCNKVYAPSTCLFTSDPWTIQGFMIVPTYLYKSPKYNIEIGVGIGDLTGTMPANNLVFTPPLPVSLYTSQGIINTKILNQTQSAYSTNNFAVSFEMAFRYMIAKNLILSASADVVLCDLTFKSTQQLLSDTAGNVYAGTLPNYLQPFRLVHLNIGLGFQLDN